MLDTHRPTPERRVPPIQAAKWPPDDDDAPGAPPAPGGGAPMGGDDGNFKKGRFNPIVILVGVVAAVGLAVFLFIGLKQDAEKLTIEQAEEHKRAIYVLPRPEQLPKWRQWAATDRSDELKTEALKQLAWLRDPEGVDLAIRALADPSEPVQAMAATALAEYGRPMGEKARPTLLQALPKAGPGARPQIAWALVVLGESSAFDQIMVLYRAGHLSKVQRLGGGVAFDPDKLASLVSPDELAKLAGDQSAAVRQLVATVLSRLADPKHTDVLIKLVQDADGEISRQAAPGLGKIGDVRARTPLLTALESADKESRSKFLEALRDGIGAEGLVLALEAVKQADEQKAWFERKSLLGMIRKLADPRGGDALHRFVREKANVGTEGARIHWDTEAAIAMAEVGDLRAVPVLAQRLKMDPLKIYSDQNDMEMALKRDDNERVVAARMIADLAVLHPGKLEEIRAQAEDGVIRWIHELPSPHANGLRALAAMGSTKDLEALRKWANPDKPMPKEGQQPPMPEEWVIAQSAMRYVGWLKDENSWSALEKALKRRPAEIDVTMDGLMQGGVAILGMALRAIGVGAADGFAQWRDPKAFKPLFEYVQEPKENEQSRLQACLAMAWVATDKDMLEVAKKVQEYSKTDKADSFRRACLLETLITRPIPGTSPALVGMLTPESQLETRHQVARAIGKAGFDKDVEGKLFGMLESDALVVDAALALILGGDESTAARAVAMLASKPKTVTEELADLWYRTFGYWSTEDLELGRIFRWIDNAVAISRVQIRQTPQEWARLMLVRQLENLDFDNGPHSFTRVVLRVRLYQMAQGDDAQKREGAIRALKFMREQGMLMALRDGKGPGAAYAGAAYFELMNPKVVTDVKMPEDKKEAK